LAVKRSRKTRKTTSKTRKIASKTRRKTRKVKKVKSPAKRKKPTKSSNLKHDTDLGTLTLGQYVNAKRKSKQDEIKEYEKQYLSRYKQPKTKKNVGSDLYKPEIPKPKIDRSKERKEYEQKYLSRYKQPKSSVKKSTSWTQHDVDLGRLTLSPHFNAKRMAKQDEIKEYEKQYLSSYKQPKSGVKKPSNFKDDTDIGTLTLGQYVNAKRRAKQDEIKEYEKQYLSRYKQPKSGVKKSTSWTQHDVALGRLTISPYFNAKRKTKQNEIREYEKQYLSRYKEPKTKKNTGSEFIQTRNTKTKTRHEERTQGIRAEISRSTSKAAKNKAKEKKIIRSK